MVDERVVELQQRIATLKDELRSHGSSADDPKCAALCETSAEVLGGLEMAFEHYINRSETVWQE